MSMSTFVYGVRPPDAKWLAMKAAWEACITAGVDVPPAIMKFFGYDKPDPAGIVVRLDDTSACKEHSEDGESGFEVQLDKLPPNITAIRFINSW
jgi:hypothetical protein